MSFIQKIIPPTFGLNPWSAWGIAIIIFQYLIFIALGYLIVRIIKSYFDIIADNEKVNCNTIINYCTYNYYYHLSPDFLDIYIMMDSHYGSKLWRNYFLKNPIENIRPF